MNAKERFYSGLAKETIGKITSNTDNWTSFLRTMSRNYEFTYPEQVMIYAQRPNATFCKPYEDWNAENYRRYVKRGSTGIALFVMNRDKPYLRYVFDVADTGVRRSSPELKPWEVTPENRSYVMEAMERTFGVAADGVLEAQLEDIASALAAEYWDDYKKQFLDIVANSFLEEYDELNIEVAFKNAVANSVSYTMYCRFVESPDNYFEHEDERAKLILSIYREVCWSTIDRANDVCDTLICTYGDSLDGALIYLENFAPDEARERFEERIRSLFETKWIIELVDMAMLKIREYPDKGALYCEIISKAYLNRFKYRESEMLEVLNMERSTYYDRKKEAILLFGLSLWGTAIPKLKDFLESAREEEALCYCEC